MDHSAPGARRTDRRAGLLAAGCGGAGSTAPDPGGSTLRTTYRDPRGTGTLSWRRGEPLRPRTELGPPARSVGVLATIAHLTDAHVLDAQSPARVTFLDRLGAPFESTFRPQETLTAQVLTGALYAIRALRPDAVIQGGDLIDNDQSNELAHALAALNGGRSAREAVAAATSACSRRSTPTRSTTARISMRRVTPVCSRPRRAHSRARALAAHGIRSSAITTSSSQARSRRHRPRERWRSATRRYGTCHPA